MADKKISQLPEVTNDDVGLQSEFLIVDSTDSKTKTIRLSELDKRYQKLPIGYMAKFAGAWPSNFIPCNDGDAVSRETYAELFSAIGTTYGNGDGSTTFNLPNDPGYFIKFQEY